MLYPKASSYRRIELECEIGKRGNEYVRSGSGILTDVMNRKILHYLGLEFKPEKEKPRIILPYLPHLECKKVRKTCNCTHLERLERSFNHYADFLEGEGDLEKFKLNVLINIREKSHQGPIKFESACEEEFEDGGRNVRRINIRVEKTGDYRNASSYYISSLGIPGKGKNKNLEIPVFPYSNMKIKINNLVRADAGFKEIFLSNVIDIVSVKTLDNVTGLTEYGEEYFHDFVRENIKNGNGVIRNMADGCLGLRKKFTSELSGHSSHLS